MNSPDDTTVQAAGCVLWRRSPEDGALEVCLVHRPKYDDWSWPKGKLKPGEDPLAGALREVAEETGCTAAPGAELPTLRYTAGGRPKQVRYWAAEATGGAFVATDEVDRVLWLTPGAARRRLTRPQDRDLVDALLEALRLP
ncbi:NUDIX hydrolase [Streptomyces sp. NPDC052701]|uniref:NUDIX hydrolase n=1 Tax=Streptomyces sp. NPDC052701 TaxID=3155533 RepID=UPI003438288F